MSEWNSKVTLAGEYLYAKENVSWSITSGVSHFSTSFPVKEATLGKILAASRGVPVPLIIENNLGGLVEVERVWVTGEVHSNDPRWKRVGVADIRWPLQRGHLIKKYNMRTFTGGKNKVGATLGLLGVASTTTVDDLAFKSFSLDPETVPLKGVKQTPYTSVTMLLNCLSAINKVFPDIKYESPEAILEPYKGLVIEDFSVDASMHDVLGTIMSWISAIDFYPDLDGLLKFYDRTKGGEIAILAKMGYEQEGFGHIEVISNEHSCPSYVEVIVTPKAEVRFDRNEDTSPTATISTPAKEGRFLEPVLQVVDDALPILKGGKKIRTAYRGEFINTDEWIESVGSIGSFALTHEKIQINEISGGLLNALASSVDETVFSLRWTRRMGALERYRLCFRINRRWVDRTLGFENKLISVIDTESGFRAPSPVILNYCIRMNERIMVGPVLSGGRADMLKNIVGYSEKSAEAEICPYYTVNFLDPENGIFTLGFKPDENNWIDKIFPCLCEDVPTFALGTLRQVSRPRFRSEMTRTGKYGKLSSKQDLAVILTASPASNLQSSYYRIKVTPKEISEAFGIPLDKITPALGPPWQVRIPPGQATANVAWIDKYSSMIESIFGIGEVKIAWSEILTNEDILKKLALAYGFQIYVPFITKSEGSKTCRLNSEIKPDGSIGTVTHFVSNAVARTTAIISNQGYPRKLESLLDEGTRAIIFGMVKQ